MSNWDSYNRRLLRYPELGFSLDTSRMSYPEGFFAGLRDEIARAYREMDDLEAGGIANPDEENDQGGTGRQVGHYWLRNSSRAPAEHQEWIEEIKTRVGKLVEEVHSGKRRAANGSPFHHVLLIGIGGSALGPQLVYDALAPINPPLDLHFLDNTDPGGMDRIFGQIGDGLAETLVIVTSKSGTTAETRNGMLETERRFREAGIDFPKQAVAVTGVGSELDKRAVDHGWISRFEMKDWIGGRTSVMSAVGLLPAALAGVDIEAFLHGAYRMDERTRCEMLEGEGDTDERVLPENVAENAALVLALMWWFAGDGKGARDMVVIPYCDRLSLMSRYLQQLVMESLGKEFERGNEVVAEQGIAVYGNKGSTDQHAYVQQLRDGLHNFFLTFIEIQRTRRPGRSESVDNLDSLTGDYLQGFLRGTREALFEKERQSITITFDRLNAFTLGALIALYERAVGFYASLININAYHQPGVQAGKKAAGAFLKLTAEVRQFLSAAGEEGKTAEDVAAALGETARTETVYHVLNHLAANGECRRETGALPREDRFTHS